MNLDMVSASVKSKSYLKINDRKCNGFRQTTLTMPILHSKISTTSSTECKSHLCFIQLFEQPFFVCIDFEKKAIIVTIRGTLSDMDALTDIVATPDVIPVDGNDGTWKAHKVFISYHEK